MRAGESGSQTALAEARAATQQAVAEAQAAAQQELAAARAEGDRAVAEAQASGQKALEEAHASANQALTETQSAMLKAVADAQAASAKSLAEAKSAAKRAREGERTQRAAAEQATARAEAAERAAGEAQRAASEHQVAAEAAKAAESETARRLRALEQEQAEQREKQEQEAVARSAAAHQFSSAKSQSRRLGDSAGLPPSLLLPCVRGRVVSAMEPDSLLRPLFRCFCCSDGKRAAAESGDDSDSQRTQDQQGESRAELRARITQLEQELTTVRKDAKRASRKQSQVCQPNPTCHRPVLQSFGFLNCASVLTQHRVSVLQSAAQSVEDAAELKRALDRAQVLTFSARREPFVASIAG
jgi:hypothetical protein